MIECTKIENEKEFQEYLKTKGVNLNTPNKYPCRIEGVFVDSNKYVLDIYYPQDKLYPKELDNPLFIYYKPFLKKMCGKYYIYITNHIRRADVGFQLSKDYLDFLSRFAMEFKISNPPFGTSFSDDGYVMDIYWLAGYSKLHILKNRSNVNGDLLFIPKSEKKVYEWVEANKPKCFTKYENRKEIIKQVLC